MGKKNPKETNFDNPELSFYLVIFLDFLGQSTRLQQLRNLPTDDSEMKKTVEIIQATAGVVVQLRRSFAEYFQIMSDPTETLTLVPQVKKELAKKMRELKVQYRGVSDSFLITVPLKNDNEHCTPMNGVHAAMFSTCGMMAAALADGHPIRGGMDVGLGLEIAPEEVYGAAVERAYRLESIYADYPRILLGNLLLIYLDEIANFQPQSPFGQMAKNLAIECRNFVTIDTDKLPMLDFLSDGMKNTEDYPSVVGKAYDFVVKQHRAYQEKDDMKLAARYGRLRSYFEARLQNWGVEKMP
jgi:hypothetical protein